jgi:hypothetical protein
MTEHAFRALALDMIRTGAPVYGWYFVDHQDGTVYSCTRWANAVDIACDEYFTRHHPHYQRERRRALLREDTLHWPRSS